MKTHEVEVQRFRAMTNARGLIEIQVDASVAAGAPGASASVVRMTEDAARVLQALLRQQLAEVDKRKGRSQR